MIQFDRDLEWFPPLSSVFKQINLINILLVSRREFSTFNTKAACKFEAKQFSTFAYRVSTQIQDQIRLLERITAEFSRFAYFFSFSTIWNAL